jgi:hypothetical protein
MAQDDADEIDLGNLPEQPTESITREDIGPAQTTEEINLDLPTQPTGLITRVAIEARQEIVRGRLAQWLTWIFAGVLLLSLVIPAIPKIPGDWSHAKEWLQIALPATTALLGSAMGFYFGQKNN